MYITTGDRLHGDALFRKAIQAYGRLLEDYDGWAGEQTQTITPQGKFKTVGKEYYTYRNRMQRLAQYSADWWGIRVLRGQVTLQQALEACDYKMFRALVRLRADRQANPVQICYEERLRPDYSLTLAKWLERNAYEPQADWELQRADLIRRIAQEDMEANAALRECYTLQGQKKLPEAAQRLEAALENPPSLAITRLMLRRELLSCLRQLRRYPEVLAELEEAYRDAYEGDPYLGPAAPRFGRCDYLKYFEVMARFHLEQLPGLRRKLPPTKRRTGPGGSICCSN